MTTSDTTVEPPKRWHNAVGRIIAVLSLGLIAHGISEYARGIPDSYHNEKSRGLLLAMALFTQSISDEFKSLRTRMAMLALSMVILAVTFWLTFR